MLTRPRRGHPAHCLYLTFLLSLGVVALYLSGQVEAALGHQRRHHDFDQDQSLLIGDRMSLAPLNGRSKRAVTSTTTSTTNRPANKARHNHRNQSTQRPSLAESATWWQHYLPANATHDHWLLDRVFELTPGYYAAGDVAYFLEGHQALNVHDPRAYFTEERTSRSLAILLHELAQVPGRLRFAFVVRVFYELGRKIASKLDTYHRNVWSLLSKKSDDLGTKPEVSTYLDVVARAFESKEDSLHPLRPEGGGGGGRPKWLARRQSHNEGDLPPPPPPPSGDNAAKKMLKRNALFDNIPTISLTEPEPIWRNPIRALLAKDPVKHKVWNASLNEIAIHFAHTMSFFVVNATKANLLPKERNGLVAKVLGLALMDGARTMLLSLQTSTRLVYATPREAVEFFKKILTKCLVIFKHHVKNMDDEPGELVRAQYGTPQTNSYADLNPLGQDLPSGAQIPLTGPWGARLYEHLGSSERVLKLFASLVTRVPLERKGEYLLMHLPRVKQEFARTMPGFISLANSPFRKDKSENYLLYDIDKVLNSQFLENRAAESLKVRKTYDADKNRVPARCYLAGRRWRLNLRRALKGYTQTEDVIQVFVDQINLLKVSTLGGQAGGGGAGGVPLSSGGGGGGSNDLERLCLPRLEMGLKGWGISGEPPSEADAMANKFPLRNPIEGLNMDEDPFTSGARMGYRLGFMIGYNRYRNASLELEGKAPKNSGLSGENLAGNQGEGGGGQETKKNSARINSEKTTRRTAAQTARYLSRTAYWSGITAGARRTLDIAAREGYMATLKVSLRAGMLLPLEAGSRLAAIKSSSFASQAGGQAGREYVNKYLMGRDSLDEQTRRQLLELGGTYGSLAGQTIGENLGAIVGREAALEAYRRTVSRGGKVTRAKFHLDEYAAGAKVGFEFGIGQGGQVALSPSLDTSAPREFKFKKPEFSAMVSQAFGELDDVSRKVQESNEKGQSLLSKSRSSDDEQAANTKPPVDKNDGKSRSALIGENSPATSTSSASPMDRWEKDLITPLSVLDIENFHATRNHTRVFGLLKGKYTVLREVKKGMQSVSNSNKTYDLEVQAIGFMMNDIAYLSLAGTIENANVLHGSLIARDLIKSK